MTRSKRLSLPLALLLSFTLLPASLHADEINRDRKIALLFDTGGPGDGSYNDAARKALTIAKKKYGLYEPNVRELVTDGTVGDRIYRLRLMARSGYFMMIAIGPANAEAVRRVSQEYPDLEFSIINDATVSGLNVFSHVFDEKQSAYIAGFAAALASRSKRVLYVATDTPEMNRLGPYFEAGVRSAEKRAIEGVREGQFQIGITSDPSGYKVLMDQGADVIYSTWNLDSAVLNEVIKRNRERNRISQIKIIGNVPDQYYLNLAIARPHLLLSIERNITKAMDMTIRTTVLGEYLLDSIDAKNSVFGKRHTFYNQGLSIKYHNDVARSYKVAIDREIARLKREKAKF
jgi:basic membrane protein A